MTTAAPRNASPQANATHDRWSSLLTMVRARLFVATLAIPVGVLLRAEAGPGAWTVLWAALGGVVVLSAVCLVAIRTRRAFELQAAAQLGADALIVALLAAYTGGRDSQFVLFFALVVIAGGLVLRLPGGLAAAGAVCAAFLALPTLAGLLGQPAPSTSVNSLAPGMLVAFLTSMGVLAGILGDRVARTRDDLERTTRELDRVRIDNDVILRHLTTGVFTVDGRGRVAYLNPTAEQVLALRALEIRGRTVEDALPERLGPLRDLVRETLDRRAPRARAELLLHTVDGRALPLGISTNLLVHAGTVPGVVAVFQDLTEVREMERRARRNETLAEIGALAAAIAHELRNGLNPISGSVECLQRELKLDGENAVLMGLIVTECGRLNRFVSDLLSYTRDRGLALENMAVAEQLEDLCEEVRRDPARGQVDVRCEGSASGALLRADREQMRQVWLNLVRNALEALRGRGTLTIRWREADNNQCVVEFIDNGPGIAAEDLPRVGQPFFTTKEGGTGLGLAIAQRIVERHGGTLTLDSASGRGTTARVCLPGLIEAVAQAA